ncbi:MAG: hypothetical protein U0T32_07395 [Chitinophagales bacterium]
MYRFTSTYTVASVVLVEVQVHGTQVMQAVATVNSLGVVTPVGAGSCNIYYTVTVVVEVQNF